ncbi:MAG: LLM class flavin-dependent oxidoreductase [Nocardiaceae bacterium]|nr:LLM class flavin-dependent oxidoreductase [Nocardiaceae bacterium]
MELQFGLDTFGSITKDVDGRRLTHAQVIRNTVDQAVLADEVGVDAFGIGEHHRNDFAVSAPEMLLAAAASRTERIKLGTAVTVLSSDDPIRVYERFATLDALSGGRAEVTLGRGSFTESFPLFGYDLADYETLFNEKLDLFDALRSEKRVSWSGTIREPLVDTEIFPKTEKGTLDVWIGVGGTPQSVVRAARYRMPLMIASIGCDPKRFATYVEFYERAIRESGGQKLPVGMHSPGFIHEDDQVARDLAFKHSKEMRDRIGRERGWAPMTRDEFEHEVDYGSTFVGTPEAVARKIADTVAATGISRFDLKYDSGSMPHELLLESIRLYGTEVIPRVRELLATRSESAAS